MKNMMFLAFLLVIGCSSLLPKQGTKYIRFPPVFLDPTDPMYENFIHPETLTELKSYLPAMQPAIEFQGAGFSDRSERIRNLLTDNSYNEYLHKSGYELLKEWYEGNNQNNTLDKDLTDEFITHSYYELHFSCINSASNLVQHFSREFQEAGWKEKRKGLFLEESLNGPDWIRVYEKDGMKTHVHIPGPFENSCSSPGKLFSSWFTLGFLNCSPNDVFNPVELYNLTNGMSSAKSNQAL